jgi:hypothetical protein
MDLQNVINNHSKVFEEMHKGLPPIEEHVPVIHWKQGSVHPVFHVSFLNKITNDKIPVQTTLLEMNGEGKIILELETIIEIRIKKFQN